MNGLKFAGTALVVLWVAGGLQRSVAPHLAFGAVTPDFLLVAIGTLALYGSRRSGSIMGFFGGVIQGALAGANMTAYVISRAIMGFAAGSLTALEFEISPLVNAFVVAVGTIGAQFLLMFIAPPASIGPFLLATIGTAVYNGVLAIVYHVLLRRVLNPPSRR